MMYSNHGPQKLKQQRGVKTFPFSRRRKSRVTNILDPYRAWMKSFPFMFIREFVLSVEQHEVRAYVREWERLKLSAIKNVLRDLFEMRFPFARESRFSPERCEIMNF